MIERVLTVLSTSSIWIAICSFFRPACLALLFGLSFDWRAGLAVLLAAFAVYATDKVSGSKEDLLNTPDRAWLAAYPIKQLAAISYLAALGVAAILDICKLQYILIIGLAGVIYTTRIFGIRPKDIPGAKTVIVAGASAVCYAGMIGGPAASYVLAFLVISIDTIIFDLRDLTGDRAACVRTLPVLFGRGKVSLLLVLLDIVVFVISPVVAIYGAFLIWFFQKDRDNLSYDLLVDAWLLWIYLFESAYIALLQLH